MGSVVKLVSSTYFLQVRRRNSLSTETTGFIGVVFFTTSSDSSRGGGTCRQAQAFTLLPKDSYNKVGLHVSALSTILGTNFGAFYFPAD